jgi:hypothetical protein
MLVDLDLEDTASDPDTVSGPEPTDGTDLFRAAAH